MQLTVASKAGSFIEDRKAWSIVLTLVRFRAKLDETDFHMIDFFFPVNGIDGNTLLCSSLSGKSC